MTAPPRSFAEALQDRYTIERELGRGGMATVYLAHDLRHHRRVGLKVLRPELASAIGPERFIREIRLTARLQHPHILPVFDSGETEGLLWYTMPFIEGESLRGRLNREGQLPVDEALRLTREVADALHYAHGQGIVHRDIKPENILLSQGHALVADFGIAQALDPGTSDKLTDTGLALGTATYMSPEQATGGQVDSRTDQYALGCVLFELLTGEPPYDGPTAHAVIAKRFSEPLPAIERRRPGVPPGVATAVGRTLALNPGDRFPSLEVFATALSPSVTGAPSTAEGRTRRVRSRLVAAGAVAVALALAIALREGFQGRSAPPTSSTSHRIAVIPFDNEGGPGREYLAAGIADGIRGKLATLPAVQVIASSSSEEYRRAHKPAVQVGRELGVDHVVIGKVRWLKNEGGGDRLEVVPQLVETRTGAIRWEKQYDSSPDEVLPLEAEVATGVAEALGLSLHRPEKVVLNDTLTANPAAFDAFLRAVEARRQYEHYNGDIGPVVALFQRAIELDTGFALAKVRLADALRSQAMKTGDTTYFRQADSLLGAVLRSRPDLADAYVVRAEIRQYQDDRQGAYRLLVQAATLQKNNATVLGRLAWLQATEGDSAATRTGALAVSLAPRDRDMLRRVIAGTAIFRHFDELVSYCDRLIEISPDDQMGYLNKALAQVWSRGDTAGAMQTLRNAERAMGRFQNWMVWPYAMAGPSGWRRLSDVSPAILTSADDLPDRVSFFLWKARLARMKRRPRELRADADSIIALVKRAPATLPVYGTLLLARAYANAVRGDRTSARRDLAAAEVALSQLPASWRNQLAPDLAEAYAIVGDTARAYEEIRQTLLRPTGFTKRGLAFSPEFSWLWGTSRLQQLLADRSLP